MGSRKRETKLFFFFDICFNLHPRNPVAIFGRPLSSHLAPIDIEFHLKRYWLPLSRGLWVSRLLGESAVKLLQRLQKLPCARVLHLRLAPIDLRFLPDPEKKNEF